MDTCYILPSVGYHDYNLEMLFLKHVFTQHDIRYVSADNRIWKLDVFKLKYTTVTVGISYIIQLLYITT